MDGGGGVRRTVASTGSRLYSVLLDDDDGSFLTNLLSHWDFSMDKSDPGKASCNRVALPLHAVFLNDIF